MPTDKVIAITGASSGIGEATARLLVQHGAKVVLGARREERLQALVAELGDEHAAALPIDVRRREDLTAFVALAVERFGHLDALVNNAGIGPISPLANLRVDDWDAMIDINVKGVLYGIAAALPVFQAQGFGHIVNTASTAAHRIVPTMAVYAATKGAVRTISEGLRQEAGPNLRVTVISPGYIATEFANSVTDPAIREQIASASDSFAIAPDAIARAILFALEQPPEVDVGEIIVRPTAQA